MVQKFDLKIVFHIFKIIITKYSFLLY